MKLISPSRVKVYELSTDASWKDLGTGYCTFANENQAAYKIKVVSEDDDSKYILDNDLIFTEKYQKEQASLIVWTESGDRDMALSFQESEKCQEIWEKIKQVQAENGYGSDSDGEDEKTDSETLLPNPTVGNLSTIEAVLARNCYIPSFRDKLISFIIEEDYIDKLISVLDTCESLDDIDDAHALYRLMKQIVLYNDSSIFEHIIKDERFHGFVGIMEYDPEFSDEKDNYREFLSNHLSFKEIVPIRDKAIENKIHQVFRLKYLIDVVLARLFDDAVTSTLNSLIIFYNIDIVDFIKNNTSFQVDLFNIFESESAPNNKKIDTLNFINQFVEIHKTLPISHRGNVYQTLSNNGLFTVFEHSLQSTDSTIRLKSVEVLGSILENNKSLARSYILNDTQQYGKKKSLLFYIVNCIKNDTNTQVQVHCVELLKMMLDSSFPYSDYFASSENSNDGLSDPELESFLTLFYDKYIKTVMQPILLLSSEKDIDSTKIPIYSLLCELLSQEISQHSFRSRHFIFSSDIIKHALILYKCSVKSVQIIALKLFRASIEAQDEFFYKYLIRNNLIKPTLDLLISTDSRYNLINSACLELFDFILKSKNKSLVSHIVNSFTNEIKQIPYTKIFEDLVALHETNQNKMRQLSEEIRRKNLPQESGYGKESPVSGIRGWSTRIFDEDEEAYFDESDDDEEPGTNLPINIGTQANPEGVSAAVEIKKSNSSELHISEDSFDYDSDEDLIDLNHQVPAESKDGIENFENANSEDAEHSIPVENNIIKTDKNLAGNFKSPDISAIDLPLHQDEKFELEIAKDSCAGLNRKNKVHIDTPIPRRGLSLDLKTSPTPNSTNLNPNKSPSHLLSPLAHRLLPSRLSDNRNDDDLDKMEALASKSLKRDFISMQELQPTTENKLSYNSDGKSKKMVNHSSHTTDRSGNASKRSKIVCLGNNDPGLNASRTPEHRLENDTNSYGSCDGVNMKKFGSPKKLSFAVSGGSSKPLTPKKLTRSNSESINEDFLNEKSLFRSSSITHSSSSGASANSDSDSASSSPNGLDQSPQSQTHLISFKISPKHARKNLSFGNSSL